MTGSVKRPQPLAALGHRALAVAPELYAVLRLAAFRETGSGDLGTRDVGPRIHRATWRPLPVAG
jgi:hypothetical protein